MPTRDATFAAVILCKGRQVTFHDFPAALAWAESVANPGDWIAVYSVSERGSRRLGVYTLEHGWDALDLGAVNAVHVTGSPPRKPNNHNATRPSGGLSDECQ